MAKRKETLGIEKALMEMTKDRGIYGCEEITIGFIGKGYGGEIVDFMTMDSKGIIRCYEIKVTLQDLKSKAKKSWYGNYNYLVVSEELRYKIHDWNEYLPNGVGLLMGYKKENSTDWKLQSVFKPKKQKISDEISMMLKESMVRSIYYKMNKYYDAQSIEKTKKLNEKMDYWERQYRSESRERIDLFHKIRRFERLKRKNEGKRVTIDDCIEIEMQKAGIVVDEPF